MVFVIDCPANFFDIQFIAGECELTEDFIMQKRCFGLTDPINAVYSVNALTEAFWKVFGCEAKAETSVHTKNDVQNRIRLQLKKIRDVRLPVVEIKKRNRCRKSYNTRHTIHGNSLMKRNGAGRDEPSKVTRCRAAKEL
jgi:hypothetical protein